MNNEYEIDEEIEQKRATEFYKRKTKVHISKRDGMFFNGFITEVGSSFFFMIDQENGNELVFFKELKKSITKYMEVKK